MATQGRNWQDKWVSRYMIQYSNDGEVFQFYKEATNSSVKGKGMPTEKDCCRNLSQEHI